MNRTQYDPTTYIGDYAIPRSYLFEGPPSPAASRYSEMDSEPDTLSSGENFSMEDVRKVETLTQRSVERNREINESSTDVHDKMLLDRKVLRALLIYVRETRARLEEAESKIRCLSDSMATLQKSHEQQLLALAKSLLTLQSQQATSYLNDSPENASHHSIVDESSTLINKSEQADENTIAHGRESGAMREECTSQSFNKTANYLSGSNNSDLVMKNGAKPPVYAVVKKKQPWQTRETESFHVTDEQIIPDVIASPDRIYAEVDAIPKPQHSEELRNAATELSSAVEFSINDNTSNRPDEEPDSSNQTDCQLSNTAFPRHTAIDSDTMASRYSGDGFYISNTFVRSASYGKNGNPIDMRTHEETKHLKRPSRKCSPSSKPAAIINKMKMKLKETRRKVSRTASKDSVESVATSSSEPVFDDGNDVAIEAHNIRPMPRKDDDNNNLLEQLNDVINREFVPVYAYANESQNDTYPSNLVDSNISKQPGELDETQPRFERGENKRVGVSRRPPISPRSQLPRKASSSFDLLSRRPLVPVRRTCSSSSIVEEPSTWSDDETEILPQTVVNRLYQKVSLLNTEGYCHCEIGEDGKVILCMDDEKSSTHDRYILDDVVRQQADMEKYGEPPPKPPFAYPGGRPHSPQHGNAVYDPTNFPGMHPTGSRVPRIPPKPSTTRFMTPEELANYEAQKNLQDWQRRQEEEANLEQKLAEQRRIAEEDAEWIKAQQNMSRDGGGAEDHPYHSADEVRNARAPAAVPPSKPPRNPIPKDVIAPAPPKLVTQEVKLTPTTPDLNRDGDNVYQDTMSVVKSVLESNHKVMDAKPDEIIVLVKNIGKALKELCTSLDQEMPSLPLQFHREIDMAQKTTNKDLSQIINQMKLVKKFFQTTQVHDYKKCLMAANQVLAMDAKNLLDVVDKARLHKLATEPSSSTSTSVPTPPPETEQTDPPTPSLPETSSTPPDSPPPEVQEEG